MISLMSLWSKLKWRHWRLKHLDHWKTHIFLRSWCWIMRSFKNDQTLIQFWINCWLQSRLTHKHGWLITVELLFPQRTGALGEPSCVTYQKQWALYHTTALDKNRVDGYRLSSCSHREQGLWRSRFVWHNKLWALYHSTAGGRVWS